MTCSEGCRIPVIADIPRFVESDDYAKSFGMQWKRFRRTQLDSVNGTQISRRRLEHCFGGNLDIVRGSTVLEVGCGAGRFTEILLERGARLYSCDLSAAVEANYENCRDRAEYTLFQADLRRLPVPPASFDIVMCLGVIQHTPDSRLTIEALARYVRPGGLLVIDHYHRTGRESGLRMFLRRFAPRNFIRELLIRFPSSFAMKASFGLTRALLPVHEMLWRPGRSWAAARSILRKLSPVADYYDRYPELNRSALREWALLDTHDGLTDRYKHLWTADEVRECLVACGFEQIETEYAGNGVEARARRVAAETVAEAGFGS